MKTYILTLAVVLLVQGAAASGCGCNSCPIPVPVPVPVPVSPPSPQPLRQCPKGQRAVWKSDEPGNYIVAWQPYENGTQTPGAFIQQTQSNCGRFEQVGGKCDILCVDDNNKELSVSPFGALSISGWAWGEDQAEVGTFCAGYVKSLPLDPLNIAATPPFQTVRCKVIPSALCCYPPNIPVDPTNPTNPIWRPAKPPGNMSRTVASSVRTFDAQLEDAQFYKI